MTCQNSPINSKLGRSEARKLRKLLVKAASVRPGVIVRALRDLPPADLAAIAGFAEIATERAKNVRV